ncbi:hypothetical protein K1719_001386 [Acacia pycnantha]|nr:hypothetical protein K1719_001386 [Acacia pycnantha]
MGKSRYRVPKGKGIRIIAFSQHCDFDYSRPIYLPLPLPSCVSCASNCHQSSFPPSPPLNHLSHSFSSSIPLFPSQSTPVMAPRKRAKSTQESTYNTHLWKSQTHLDRYKDIVKASKDKIVKERQLEVEADKFLEIHAVIERRGWQQLCQTPCPSSIEVCKEFYANAFLMCTNDQDKRVSYVRGKDVAYDPDSIDQAFQINIPESNSDCGYETTLARFGWENRDNIPKEAATVLEAIALPCVEWEWKVDRHTPRRIFRKDLTWIAKVWYHFVVSNILPSSNKNDVNLERAVLVKEIMGEAYVHISKILSNNIHKIAQMEKNTFPLAHCSLIKILCEKAGVVVGNENEKLVTPDAVINGSIIKAYQKETTNLMKIMGISIPVEGEEAGPSCDHPNTNEDVVAHHCESMQEDLQHTTPTNQQIMEKLLQLEQEVRHLQHTAPTNQQIMEKLLQLEQEQMVDILLMEMFALPITMLFCVWRGWIDAKPPIREPDFTCSNNMVYMRPQCDEFLRFCFQNFYVVVWTSRKKENADSLCIEPYKLTGLQF